MCLLDDKLDERNKINLAKWLNSRGTNQECGIGWNQIPWEQTKKIPWKKSKILLWHSSKTKDLVWGSSFFWFSSKIILFNKIFSYFFLLTSILPQLFIHFWRQRHHLRKDLSNPTQVPTNQLKSMLFCVMCPFRVFWTQLQIILIYIPLIVTTSLSSTSHHIKCLSKPLQSFSLLPYQEKALFKLLLSLQVPVLYNFLFLLFLHLFFSFFSF